MVYRPSLICSRIEYERLCPYEIAPELIGLARVIFPYQYSIGMPIWVRLCRVARWSRQHHLVAMACQSKSNVPSTTVNYPNVVHAFSNEAITGFYSFQVSHVS